MRRHVGVVLVCCLFLAGCSGFGGSADDGRFSRTVTPVPVTNPDSEAGLPPGITEQGIGSVGVLTRNHRLALENESYVLTEWEQTRSIREDRPDVVVTRTERMRVVSPTRYTWRLSRVRTTAGTRRSFRRLTYADGARWYQRTVNGSRESFTTGPVRSTRDRFAYAATFSLDQYLSIGNASITPITRNGSTLYRVRTVRPGRFNDHWSNYTVVAYIEPSGFVRRLTVSYVIERGSTRAVTAYRFAYSRRGNVSVQSPEWIDQARRADG